MTLTTLEGPQSFSLDGLKLNFGPWAQRNKAKKIQKQAQMIAAVGAATGNQSLVMVGAGRYLQGRSKMKKANRSIKTIGNVAKVGAVVTGGVLLAPVVGGMFAAKGAGAAAAGVGKAAAGVGKAAAGAKGAGLLAPILTGGTSLLAKAGSMLTGSKLLETVAGKGFEMLTGAGQAAESQAMSAIDAFSAIPPAQPTQQSFPEQIIEQAQNYLPEQANEWVNQARSLYDQYQQIQPQQQIVNQQEPPAPPAPMAEAEESRPWYMNPYVIIPVGVGIAAGGYAIMKSKEGK